MGSKNSTAALGDVARDGLPDLAGKLRVGFRAPFPVSTLVVQKVCGVEGKEVGDLSKCKRSTSGSCV